MTKVLLQTNSMDLYQVDNMFVVIYNFRVQDRCAMLHTTQQTAKSLVASLQAQQSKKDKE